jgi:acyl-CoA synthetase (AMP-forming)/AMP-acid ligase II
VGAAVVCGGGTPAADELRNRARKLLSAFKVPTVWLVLGSDDDVPRGGTGKVDIRRLRDMLIDAGRPHGTRVQG